ncbi:cytochrome c3 family protein [Desulfonauticus submarinus]
MKRSWLVGVMAAMVAALFLIPNLWALKAPTGDILLTPPAGVKKVRKGPVKFSHASHASVDCKECHHTWDGKGKIKKCTDSGCHDIVNPKGKEKRSIKYYYQAFHKNCIGCHKAEKKAGKKTGPTACNKCHAKKK